MNQIGNENVSAQALEKDSVCRSSSSGNMRGKMGLSIHNVLNTLKDFLAYAWNTMNDYDGFWALGVKTLQVLIIAGIVSYPLWSWLIIGTVALRSPLVVQWILWIFWVSQWLGLTAYLAFLEARP